MDFALGSLVCKNMNSNRQFTAFMVTTVVSAALVAIGHFVLFGTTAGTGLIVTGGALCGVAVISGIALAIIKLQTAKSGKEEQRESKNQPPIGIEEVELVSRCPQLNHDIIEALQNAVQNDFRRKCPPLCSKSAMIPFHKIFSFGKGGIYLGNDKTRAIFADNSQRRGVVVAKSYGVEVLINGDYGNNMLPMRRRWNEEVKSLPNQKIHLLISFNARGNDPNRREAIGRDLSLTTNHEFDHIQYPINETDACYQIVIEEESNRLEKEIFQKIDAALNNHQAILLHCSQGEHRSATILVLYIVSRAGCSFEDAHRLVSSKREIKPLKPDQFDSDGKPRETLMTTAYQNYQRQKPRAAI